MKEKEERKLTRAEEERKEKFLNTKQRMEEKGYQTKELTIGIVFANVMAMILGAPLIALSFIGFIQVNGEVQGVLDLHMLLLLLVFFVLIVVHELIHGATWAMFTKNHFKSISFGVVWQYLTPYCCCREVLHMWQYILGALMPTIILGIVPCVIAIISGSTFLLVLGCLMILGGGGDLTIVLKMILYRSDKKEKVFLDHPYECGMVVFEK